MEYDYIYFWDKLGSSGKRQLLGEMQIGANGVNMSFVIDGTKDSAKIIVWSYEISECIKPNTIIWHENTNTWWVVNDDKVERRPNDDGYLYIHNIQINGAIELWNARDLTDSGFNQKTYTIGETLDRLISLSTYEISNTFVYGTNIEQTKIVDYVKTFENYTLLSAIREFLDGYNCCAKLRFYQDTSDTNCPITMSYVDIVPKTGNVDRTIKSINELFNEIKEIKTMNKSSYGTTVVSNAENVVSTKKKLYPAVGLTRVSGDSFYITPSNACIRLPSKVNTVEYVDMVKGKIPVGIACNKTDDYGAYYSEMLLGETSFDATNLSSYDKAVDFVKSTLMQQGPAAIYIAENLDDDFWNNAKGQGTLDTLMEYFTFRLYDITQYDPVSNKFISDNPIYKFIRVPDGNKPFVLGEKDIRDGVQEPKEVMYWERGSNLIKGFDFFEYHGISNVIQASDNQGIQFIAFTITTATGTWNYKVIFGDYALDDGVAGFIKPSNVMLSIYNTYFRVKYIPMADIKIKYDNSGFGNDIQLYNQNGRYTDGVALSKLLVSYKDEIVSDNITRYQIGYSYSSMAKVGDIFLKSKIVDGQSYDDKYVISNASITLFMNEESSDLGYFIVGEYTLTKNVATKSLLTSPNTNIRDYGIPQTYNVKRKQLFRDFYELDFTQDSLADNDKYLDLSKVLNVGYYYSDYVSHTGVIKLTFNNAYGGGGETYDGGTAPASDTWYYQLDSTVYFMKKSMYEIIDFQDNNIIGYDFQNVTCGFDVRRLFTVWLDSVNTPVSYVDDKGQVKDIKIAMCNSTQLMGIYDQYLEDIQTQLGQTYSGTLYNRCVFIPHDIYDYALLNCDFEMNVTNYNKDALEVPVFEYSCQLDDSDNVIIGENVFDNFETDFRYMYEFVFVQHGKADDKNWNKIIPINNVNYSNNTLTMNTSTIRKNGRFNFYSWGIQLYGYNEIDIKTNEETITYISQQNLHDIAVEQANLQSDKRIDMLVLRYAVPQGFTVNDGKVQNVRVDLMFIIKNAQNCPYSLTNNLRLYANHYKLK